MKKDPLHQINILRHNIGEQLETFVTISYDFNGVPVKICDAKNQMRVNALRVGVEQ